MSNVFAVGQRVRVSVLFENSSSVATDPTAIVLKYMNPRGDVTTKTYALGEVTKDSTGNYSYVFTPAIHGTWTYKWQGTGDVVATSPDSTIVVKPSALIGG